MARRDGLMIRHGCLLLGLARLSLALAVQFLWRPHGSKREVGEAATNLCHDAPTAGGIAHSSISLTVRCARL